METIPKLGFGTPLHTLLPSVTDSSPPCHPIWSLMSWLLCPSQVPPPLFLVLWCGGPWAGQGNHQSSLHPILSIPMAFRLGAPPYPWDIYLPLTHHWPVVSWLAVVSHAHTGWCGSHKAPAESSTWVRVAAHMPTPFFLWLRQHFQGAVLGFQAE